MRGHPLERPVDHEALILAHAFDHGIGFLQRGREGFLDHEVRPVRSHLLDPLTVLRGRRAKYNHVGLGLFETLAVVGERLILGDQSLADGFFHAGRLFVANTDDLGIGMLVGVPKQIAHVEVVKVDSSNFPGSFFHWRSRVNCGAKEALSEAQNHPPKQARR